MGKMHRSARNYFLGFAALFSLAPISADAQQPAAGHWPSFRGHQASGVAEGPMTPSRWSVKAGENINWKTPIPGLGHSCPIVWADRIYTTTAISGQTDPELKVGLYGDIKPVEDDSEHTWLLLCLDKNNGNLIWQKQIHKAVPKIKRHTKATHANCTPATDGKNIVVFLGSEGLYCFDMEGQLIWKKDLGVLDSSYYRVPTAQWEFASSPIIHDDMVIVQCDVLENSFLATFGISDGAEIWRTPREDLPGWSTPTVHVANERSQVLVNGYKHIGGYELATGKELWRMTGLGDIPVPTPVVADGLAFFTSAHQGAAIAAVRLNAEGDISLGEDESANSFVAWRKRKGAAYMQTPLYYDGYIYSCMDNGVLTCLEAKTGKTVYRKRLASGRTGFTASAVASGGKLYYTSEEGSIYVIQAGPEFKVLATNAMDDVCMATPAISDGQLFFRTQHHIIAVKEAASKP